MPLYTGNAVGVGAVSADGTRPFVKGPIVGGPAGSFKIRDATGADAKVTTPASPTAGVLFANTAKAIAQADAILVAVNA